MSQTLVITDVRSVSRGSKSTTTKMENLTEAPQDQKDLGISKGSSSASLGTKKISKPILFSGKRGSENGSDNESEQESELVKKVGIEGTLNEPQRSVKFDLGTLKTSQNTAAQSGNRAYKELASRVVCECNEPIQTKEDSLEPQATFNSETINQWKRTYRSGYQHAMPENPTGVEQLMSMAANDPDLIKRGYIWGSTNGANGHNGWARQNLYYTNYLNQDGVGPAKKNG